MKKNPIVLIILDGWGIAENWAGNAITLAKTPNMERLLNKYPWTTLGASGEAVGLPFGEPGNSEVGHYNIGTGQQAAQGLSAINDMIDSGAFFHNAILEKIMIKAKEERKALHLIGLVSDGGIHAHINHLIALLKLAKKLALTKVYIHAFTDGRDTAPTSSRHFINIVEQKKNELGLGKLASISGRYFAMDRDNRWDRIAKVFNAIVAGDARQANTALGAIQQAYAEGITDEFIPPTIIRGGEPIKEGDKIIFFNFRSDRARQLTQALIKPDFDKFPRVKKLANISMATFGSYQENLPVEVAFETRNATISLAKIMGQHALKHYHIAETEKYPHVTYFFNGGEESPFNYEERILVPSPKVATYDLAPEMSAKAITQKALPIIGKSEFMVINFANADMVGHTGNIKAAIKAVETVDSNLGKLIIQANHKKTIALVTADHGNAEQMINPLTGLPDTEHTNNPVPFIFVDQSPTKINFIEEGKLSNIIPTILKIWEIDKPKELIEQGLFA